MADFYQARFAATFFTDGGKEVVLTRVHDLLPAEVEEEWSAGTAAFDCIAHDWGQDVPTGNARLRRSWSVLLCERTRAALERRMRRVEIMLNMHRKGTLLLEEAFSQGAPTLATWWAATLETAKARPLAMESAPGMPGAWGALELAFILTHPSEEPPQDDPGTQEDDPGTQEEAYATGWLRTSGAADETYQINGVAVTPPSGQLWQDLAGWQERIQALNVGCVVTGVRFSQQIFLPGGGMYSGAFVDLQAVSPGPAGEQVTLAASGGHAGVSAPTLQLPS